MIHVHSLAALAGLGILGVTLVGCATPPQASACPAVPPLPAEAVPKPPVSEAPLVWQPGHWDWTSTNYAYQQGRYVPLHGSTTWMPGFWTQSPGGPCVWNTAHFI
ncbi:MAG TPA: hypothetical protein VGH36_00615 [Acetobacteraceae bacterium]